MMTISSSSAKMLYLDKDTELGAEQVSMFLGKTFLITLQEEGEFDVFEPVRARIRSGKGRIRKAGPDYLAYALLDSIIDHSFPVLESIGTEVDAIGDELVDNPLVRPVGSLHEHKRTLTQIRRMVWPLRDVTNLLLHEDPGLIRPETKVYLRDCHDHSVQLMDVVESYRDVLSGLAEIHISSIGLRTNEIMRGLTVISSTFMPLKFIAGVYGHDLRAHAGTRSTVRLWRVPAPDVIRGGGTDSVFQETALALETTPRNRTPIPVNHYA
jgi:magnesium transporter